MGVRTRVEGGEVKLTVNGAVVLLTPVQAHSLGEDLLRKAFVAAGHEITDDDFFTGPSPRVRLAAE